MDKKKLRKELTAKRAAIPKEIRETAPLECLELLRQTKEYKDAKVIYPFVSFRTELDTISLIPKMLEDGKIVAVPRVEGDIMHFYRISSLEDCNPGAWGILEPKEYCPLMEEAGLIFVPGLGYDLEGGRIGYGGGFYDKYLSQHPDFLRMGYCFEEQIVETITMEEHDIRTQCLLTPKRFLYFKA